MQLTGKNVKKQRLKLSIEHFSIVVIISFSKLFISTMCKIKLTSFFFFFFLLKTCSENTTSSNQQSSVSMDAEKILPKQQSSEFSGESQQPGKTVLDCLDKAAHFRWSLDSERSQTESCVSNKSKTFLSILLICSLSPEQIAWININRQNLYINYLKCVSLKNGEFRNASFHISTSLSWVDFNEVFRLILILINTLVLPF